jgi:hypothetical protein
MRKSIASDWVGEGITEPLRQQKEWASKGEFDELVQEWKWVEDSETLKVGVGEVANGFVHTKWRMEFVSREKVGL